MIIEKETSIDFPCPQSFADSRLTENTVTPAYYSLTKSHV